MDKGVKFVEWHDTYSVGIPAIDEQHKQVLKILNSVFASVKNRNDSKALLNNLKKLWIFTLTHFSYEETLLEVVEYPRLDEHRRNHSRMKSQTSLYIADLEARQPDEIVILNFIKDWWINHINREDKDYTDYLLPLEL